MLTTSTLKPGLLVSLKTSLRGNVEYTKQDIAHSAEDGRDRATWETTRTIADIAEHEAAKKARSKAVAILRSVCSLSAFGMLCPESELPKLETAITAARGIVDAFNATARLSRIGLYVIVGRIAADDVEAMRAINSEVRELLDQMANGVKNLDAKAVRDAANKATQLGQVLTPEAEDNVKVAVQAARRAARRIAQAGETAALEIDQEAVRRITSQRAAFIDLGDDVVIAKPVSDAVAVDFEPVESEAKNAL